MRPWRPLRLALLALALIVPACYPSVAPPALTEGLWAGGNGDRDLVLEFKGSHLGVHALIQVMRGGRRVTEKRAFKVTLVDRQIDIWLDGDWSYSGRIDFELGRIEGEISGPDGTPRDLVLTRVAPSAVDGFLARPATVSAGAPYSWSRPAETGDGWPTASPEEVGLDRARLEEAVSTILAGEVGLIHSLLVLRHGKLVLEEYFHGYDRDDLHDIGSCTLGISSLLIGIAVDRKQIADVATPVPSFFPQFQAYTAPGWDRTTLENVMSMTSVRVRKSGITMLDTPVSELFFRDVLSEEPHARPGTEWLYSDRHVNLLAGVLKQSTGLPPDEFAQAHLFEPLGIDRFEWDSGMQGTLPRMHDDLRLRPLDLAKLGALLLDQGNWQGHQVVSEEWIRTATSGHSRSPGPDPEDYGYLWWAVRLPESHGRDPVFLIWGMGGQYLWASPSLDSVVVVTGGNQFNDKSFLVPEILAYKLLAAYPAPPARDRSASSAGRPTVGRQFLPWPSDT